MQPETNSISMEDLLKENEANTVMQQRGYTLVSSSDGSKGKILNYAKRIEGSDFPINAAVHLRSSSIELSFVGLKYFFFLTSNPFTFHHAEFPKLEKVLLNYASVVANLSFDQLNMMSPSLAPSAPVPPPSPAEDGKPETTGKSIKEREDEFWEKVRQKAKPKNMSKKEALKFFKYWTEKNERGKRMRFEKENTFDISRRIDTWMSNNFGNKKDWREEKIEQQNKQITTQRPIDTNTLF